MIPAAACLLFLQFASEYREHMRLMDFFAAQVGAALASRADHATKETAQQIARRAYDIAEAMLRERTIRGLGDAEGEGAIEPEEVERVMSSDEIRFYESAGEHLLDEPMPLEDEDLDPHWQSLANDPAWEADPKWGPPFSAEKRDSDRPGLARTTPAPVIDGGLRRKA